MSAVDDLSDARVLGRRLRWRRVLGGLTAAFIVTAGLAWGVLSLMWPEAPVHMHVRWRPDVTDAQRVELERDFHLIHGVRTEGMSWEYQLIDTSTANIRQLIQDARVDDTAHLNRIRYRPEFAQDRSRQIVAYSLAIGAIRTLAGWQWLRLPVTSANVVTVALSGRARCCVLDPPHVQLTAPHASSTCRAVQLLA